MKLADRILLHLLKYGRKDPSEIMIPNFYHFGYEMDMFKLTSKQLVVEYEVKISRADYHNDFKKNTKLWKQDAEYKHDIIAQGKAANSFCFVVPEGMVHPNEVPKHCGLMYFRPAGSLVPSVQVCLPDEEPQVSIADTIYSVKPSPVLHKNKFTDFQALAKSLSWRENNWREKFHAVKNGIQK